MMRWGLHCALVTQPVPLPRSPFSKRLWLEAVIAKPLTRAVLRARSRSSAAHSQPSRSTHSGMASSPLLLQARPLPLLIRWGSMFFWAGLGHSNYNAGFISLHERAWKGLTLDANLTYA